MSLKSEVEELLDWLAELKAAAEDDDQTVPVDVTKHAWGLLATNLDRVAELFGSAATVLGKLTSPNGVTIAAELARSLQRETEDLQRRAATLGRRADAPPATDSSARKAFIKREIRSMADDDEKRAGLEAELEEIVAGEPLDEVRPAVPTLQEAEDVLSRAGTTLETARRKVAGKHGDVAAGFLDELEVVIEMNLSLRRRCAELGDPT